jgi:hypothetical protein
MLNTATHGQPSPDAHGRHIPFRFLNRFILKVKTKREEPTVSRSNGASVVKKPAIAPVPAPNVFFTTLAEHLPTTTPTTHPKDKTV